MALALGHSVRRVVPRSLFWRSLLIVVLPLVILQIILTVIFYIRHWDTVTLWLALGVAGDVAVIAEMVEEAPSESEIRAILDRFSEHTELWLSLDRGAELAETMAELRAGAATLGRIDQKIIQGFDEKLDRPFALDLYSQLPSRVVAFVELDDGVLRVEASRKRVTSTTTGLLLAWMVGSSLVLTAIAVYLLRLQVRPIRQLARAVDSFGKGRDVGDFRLRGSSEIRRAAGAFNLMRQRILRHISQRTEMLAAISHDLRTPLTRMKLELEMLGDDDPMVEGLKADVEDMISLVETYLTFVQNEEAEAVQAVDITAMLQSMRQRAERAGLEVELDSDDGLEAPVRLIAFRRCLSNLIDNACRFGGWIRIIARRRAEDLLITIEDDGPGVPPDLREKVFQPFFRLDQARRRETGGTGLGLTIARDIVRSHGGELTLEASERGGAKAVLRLPF